MGTRRTLAKFRKRFKFSKDCQLAKEVTEHCHRCQVNKDYKVKNTPTGAIQSNQPWHTLAADTMGPLPACQGKQFIPTFIDRSPNLSSRSRCQQRCQHSNQTADETHDLLLRGPCSNSVRSWDRIHQLHVGAATANLRMLLCEDITIPPTGELNH